MRESFVFYKSFYDAILKLPEEYQLELLKVIMAYNFDEQLPKMSPIVEAMFTLIKTNIDKATERYNRCVENGKKGGRPITEEKPKNNQDNNLNKTKKKPKQNQEHNQDYNQGHNLDNNLEYNLNVNVNDNDNVNDNVNVNDNLFFLFKEKINKKKDELKESHQSFQVYLLLNKWTKEQPEFLKLTEEERRKVLTEI